MILHCSFAYEGERGKRGDSSRGLRLRDEIKPAGNKIQHYRLARGGNIGLEYPVFFPCDLLKESMWFVGENEKSSRGNLYLYYHRTSHQLTKYNNTLTILLQGGSHTERWPYH